MEIMVVWRPMTLPHLLCDKELLVTDSFKYFASFFAYDGAMGEGWTLETSVHWPYIRQFQDVWASLKLTYRQKMDAHCTFVFPFFLYGCNP
eukprot:356565-Chlamydomonas_euryale.AAC.6